MKLIFAVLYVSLNVFYILYQTDTCILFLYFFQLNITHVKI